ncbi:MAG TPA: hypothetical protein DCE71_07895, partial [Parachlamydiales bacterium]|nr:hypothetical protein [Parachlamydiales bacterium]
MITQNLIQAAANVGKITRMSKGDCVKLVEDGYGSPEIFYGIVIDLLNSGEKCFVQILRYRKSFMAINCDIKTYAGDKDITIFPATVDELQEHFKDAIIAIERDVKRLEKDLSDKKMGLQRAQEFVSMESSRKLQSAAL